MEHVIWDSEPSDELREEEREMFLEENPETDEGDLDEIVDELVYETLGIHLQDEVSNLDKNVSGEIFLAGSIERWDGSHTAYKPLKTKNIGKAIEEAIRSFEPEDHFVIGVDDGKMVLHQTGHDNPVNPSIVEFRYMEDVDSVEEEVFQIRESAGSMPGIVDELISRSKSVAAEVCQVYGWELTEEKEK